MREIVLDTETTGLHPESGDRIVEIGAIELINHIPTGKSFHSYLNPSLEKEMPEESFKVHGLSIDFLSDKPFFSEIIESFYFFIGSSKLVIHNARFDIGFINYEIQRLENTNPEIYARLPYKEIDYKNVIDTMTIARNRYPGRSISLDSLCIKFGIDNKRKGTHGAIIDSEILSEVYLELEGGKQPNFHFAPMNFNHRDEEKKSIVNRTFSRKAPLKTSRLTEDEKVLHKKFIFEMKQNFWY